jgi:hypothetical protein
VGVWGRAFLGSFSLAFYYGRRLFRAQDLQDTNGDSLPLLQPPGLPFYVSNILILFICIFTCELRVYLYLANNLFCIKEVQVIDSIMFFKVCCCDSSLSQLIWMHSCGIFYKFTSSVDVMHFDAKFFCTQFWDQASCFSWKYLWVGLFCIWLKIWKSYYSTSQLTCMRGYLLSIIFLVNVSFSL